jgi:hypothetical protein
MIWYETCGRSLAVGLRLVAGPWARPPISTMGSKMGYARVILGVLGYREGQGCEEVWAADPSEWAPVYQVLAGPAGEEVAAILRSWAGEPPRELWERCRKEGWGELTRVDDVARFSLVAYQAVFGQAEKGFDANGGNHNHDAPKPIELIASRVSAVARWLVAAGWGWRAGEPDTGFNAFISGERVNPSKIGHWSTFGVETTPRIASRIRPWPVPLRYHHGSCLDVPVPSDASGVVVYADPSYRATSGYKSNIYAEDLKDYLMSWHEAGATVAVSEARPLDSVFPGWHVVRIDGERRGQKRIFSAQQAEYLTVNRPPAWIPGRQLGVFDAR